MACRIMSTGLITKANTFRCLRNEAIVLRLVEIIAVQDSGSEIPYPIPPTPIEEILPYGFNPLTFF